MADTLQAVSWALERPCELRHGPEWPDPLKTAMQLHPIVDRAHAAEHGDVIDGIRVTSTYSAWDAAGNDVGVPAEGYVVAKDREALVRFEVAQRICPPCEANACPTCGVTGCHGWLCVEPYAGGVESALRGAIQERELADAVGRLFLPTRPVWYGLWARSPLDGEAVRVLAALVQAVPVRPYAQGERAGFLRAADAAVRHGLRLHVRLAPPGHTDFGYTTTFAHCPRCKALCRGVRRWSGAKFRGSHACAVCGFVYEPAATYRSERDSDDASGVCENLEQKLGSAFESFAMRHGAARGVSEASMREALEWRATIPARQGHHVGMRFATWWRPNSARHEARCAAEMARIAARGHTCAHCGNHSVNYRLQRLPHFRTAILCRRCAFPVIR